jgi:predicted AAA+ superfamily ATPase
VYTTAYLNEVVEIQQSRFFGRDSGVPRAIDHAAIAEEGFATIVTGVRRCGKSTLLRQLAGDDRANCFFMNFEDIRLSAFDREDFIRLDHVVSAANVRRLFFDEVQVVDGWERYVRQKLDDGCEVYVTGSNASMLSRELGTRLTGRHLQAELFPFSYTEYCTLKQLECGPVSAEDYLHNGGFPEFIKTGNAQVIQQLTDDILHRDIAVRYGIRDVGALRRLAAYLFANIARPFSANKLAAQLSIKAVSTVGEYIDHLEAAYLIATINRYSHSEKARLRNPRKAYCIDNAVVEFGTVKTSDDLGRKLENLVFLHLRRHFRSLFYFQEQHECDFIAFAGSKPKCAVQACYVLTEDNLDRELNGGFEALDFLGMDEGIVVTLNQSDRFTRAGKTLEVLPLHRFLTMVW